MTECFDAFTVASADLGRTFVITYTIKSGEAYFSMHKLTQIPFAKLQLQLQKLKRLVRICEILRAEPIRFKTGALVKERQHKNESTLMIFKRRESKTLIF